MEMNEKMFRLDRLPFQFRMIKIFLTERCRKSSKDTEVRQNYYMLQKPSLLKE